MHIRLIAVGDRQPSWVDAAFENYLKRLPRQWQFRLDPVASAPRTRKSGSEGAIKAESEMVLAKIRQAEFVVVLDERGTEWSSRELADRLQVWQQEGRDLAFVIGGPDGVSAECLDRADLRWSLSRLTLAHGLARVLLIEQLYRAWCLLSGHPYHRA
ncbi:MAG TPA: 23S rRNA (pseudouridine(1915)-N(3))-methyltransferase RlmH [Sphingomonadaceae bacterium]|nr:23S rRNA (pseudouridine(1915)-N(3))-methyltransferase RlmH [Sphingomonadaceae bacterium]